MTSFSRLSTIVPFRPLEECWVPIVKRLPHRLGIILPSRDRRARPLSGTVQQEIDRGVSAWFARAIGGSTEERIGRRDRMIGRFQVKEGRVIVEAVKEVWAQCSHAEFRKHRSHLIALAEWVCHRGDQVVVAVLIDGEMQLVAAPTGRVPRPS